MGEKETGEFITHLAKNEKSPHQLIIKLYVQLYFYIEMY
jgi:hypothetical protein